MRRTHSILRTHPITTAASSSYASGYGQRRILATVLAVTASSWSSPSSTLAFTVVPPLSSRTRAYHHRSPCLAPEQCVPNIGYGSGFINRGIHCVGNRGRVRLLASTASLNEEDHTTTTTTESSITTRDRRYMTLALSHAQLGRGNTYPNPAVGCVIVNDSNDEVIGAGFHPRAGYPHAEVFALLEAYGHVQNGVEAAQCVVKSTHQQPRETPLGQGDDETVWSIDGLLSVYSQPDGPEHLFPKVLPKDTTAYVTLEPCCHYGKTPPCALSLVKAGIGRVVVGLRDPNPRVDGGGVTMLRDAGVLVDVVEHRTNLQTNTEETDTVAIPLVGEGWEVVPDDTTENQQEEHKIADQCVTMVDSFLKRISPMDETRKQQINYDQTINGAKRSALRSLANRQKNQGTMSTFTWQSQWGSLPSTDVSSATVGTLTLPHWFMETIDDALWEHELVLLKLGGAVGKKKGTKLLGGRMAEELGAHLVQVVGHTALLYRPALPSVLDLEGLLKDRKGE